MKVFIASSTTGLREAHAIQENLEPHFEVSVWDQNVFGISSYPLETLQKVAHDAEYGIFVMTPDDFRQRGSEQDSVPRDNVILEYGVFLGALGRHRSFLVVPSDDPRLKLPTDLEGLVQARYKRSRSDGNLRAALGPACNRIRGAIDRLDTEADQSGSMKNPSFTMLSPEPEAKILDNGRKPLSLIHHVGRLPPVYTGQFFQGARYEIIIVGFSLRSFISYFDSRPEAEIRTPIMAALGRGVKLSLVFLDPESTAAKVFSRERADRRLLEDIRRSMHRAKELCAEFKSKIRRSKMEILVYAQAPFGHMKRIDSSAPSGRLICFPYLPGPHRADMPYLEVRKRANPRLFSAYSHALDELLKRSKRII